MRKSRRDRRRPDCGIELHRLLVRGDAELLFETLGAGAILAQGGGALPRGSVVVHQRAVGRLVQRVEGQAAARRRDGPVVIPSPAVQLGEMLQGAGALLAQALGLEVLPLVEGRAVAEREAGEKVVAVESKPRLQGFPAGVRPKPGLKCRYIEPDVGVGGESDQVAFDREPAWPQTVLDG
ncbi:MAG TPA: hypothetical protein VFU22_11505 [Roseiflexaceae bacterium]|nr:hypothetical protein [Roseiflexaceae bacterium]